MTKSKDLKPFMVGWRIFLVAWHQRPWAVSGYLLGAFVEIIAFLTALYATARLGGLLAQYVTQGQSTGPIWLWLSVDLVAGLFINLALWLMNYNRRLMYFSLSQWSTSSFMSQLNRIDLKDYYESGTRDKINKIESGFAWRLPNVGQNILELIYATARFLAITLVVIQISWWVVPLIAVFLIPSLLVEGRLASLGWFVWDEKGDERHVFWGLINLFKKPRSQMEMRALQARSAMLNRHNELNHRFYIEQERRYKHTGRWLVPAKILELGGTGAGSIMVLRQLLAGTISLERYFFLSGALLRISSALNNVFGTMARMQEDLLFAKDFLEFMEQTPSNIDTTNAVQLTGKDVPHIKFDKVSFSYPGSTDKVFDQLSFEIGSGEHVALVGENGAGKSTLIKLLLRFYRPDSGRILIDGVDLNKLALESWYDRIATLFQQFNEYPFSIKENIEIGRSDTKHDEARLLEAGRLSGVDSMISGYKYGWETVLDSSFTKGTEPSGGQWQRVALARAFYRRAPILILDEPTAAIDAKAEYQIFNDIFAEQSGNTAIIVSHRFSTVRKADRILVFDDGKIKESGSHTELMKKQGLYHEMFTKQAEGYK